MRGPPGGRGPRRRRGYRAVRGEDATVRASHSTWVIACLILTGSCAKVTVRPSSRSLDRAEHEGMPFYLQRPYVVIEREMPIEGCEGYLSALYDPNTDTYEL